MMYPRDAAKLAYTKIRTRRVRLIVTTAIMSLLFAILVAASLLVRGFEKSLSEFSSEGFANRYIVMGESMSFFTSYSDPELIVRAETLQKDLIARKKAYAKANGIDYDANSEPPAVQTFGDDRAVDGASIAGRQAIQQYIDTKPHIDLEAFKKQLAGQDVKQVYETKRTSTFGTDIPTLQVLQDGKEDFSISKEARFSGGSDINSLSNQWELMDPTLIQPFLLENQNVAITDSIPVIAPYRAAQQILGLKSLPLNATATQKKERLKEVRQHAAGKIIEICYRNTTSQRQIDDAKGQQALLKQQANNKDFQKPDLLYDVPAEACGSPRVVQDKRTGDTKKTDAKLEQFRREFGEPAAVSQKLKLRIVGISSGVPGAEGTYGLADALTVFTTSTLGSGWISPLAVADSSPVFQDIFRPQGDIYSPTIRYVAEFNSVEGAKKALTTANCQFDVSGGSDPYTLCMGKGKPFVLVPFGSSSLAVKDAVDFFGRAFLVAGAVIAAIASFIMMGVIGRVIADSRRETAVFRAVGATKFDITQIYATYTLYLALLILIIALMLGVSTAAIISSINEAELSVGAAVAFSSRDLDKHFQLFALNAYDLGFIVVVVFAAAIIGSLGPISTNVRRSPMQDMRDE